jgi:hypothetical protein
LRKHLGFGSSAASRYDKDDLDLSKLSRVTRPSKVDKRRCVATFGARNSNAPARKHMLAGADAAQRRKERSHFGLAFRASKAADIFAALDLGGAGLSNLGE